MTGWPVAADAKAPYLDFAVKGTDTMRVTLGNQGLTISMRPKLATGAMTLAACITAAVSASQPAEEPAEREDFHVVGYLPWYSVAGDRAETTLSGVRLRGLTHLIFIGCFKVAEDGGLDLIRLGSEDASEPEPGKVSWATLLRLRAITAEKDIKLGIAIGAEGWMKGPRIAAAGADPAKRTKFAMELAAFCDEHGLDCVDFDWEAPNSPEEEKAYTELLKECKRVLAPKGITISVCVLSASRGDKPMVDREGLATVDYVHIMGYFPGRQRPLLAFRRENVDFWCEERGADRGKVMVGMPFFCRNLEKRGRERHLHYRQLVEQAGITPSTDFADGYLLNGVDTVKATVRYAWNEGLAGVMIWSLEQDLPIGERDDLSLMAAIADAVIELRDRAQP
jgi:GH18 family chitinase